MIAVCQLKPFYTVIVKTLVNHLHIKAAVKIKSPLPTLGSIRLNAALLFYAVIFVYTKHLESSEYTSSSLLSEINTWRNAMNLWDKWRLDVQWWHKLIGKPGKRFVAGDFIDSSAYKKGWMLVESRRKWIRFSENEKCSAKLNGKVTLPFRFYWLRLSSFA